MRHRVYVLDANVFIQAAHQYYAFGQVKRGPENQNW